MVFPDGGWPRGGELYGYPSSSQEERFEWYVWDLLTECRAKRQESRAGDKRVRSVDFSFGGATWNLFLSFDQEDSRRGLFGVNVRTHTAPDTELDCWGHVIFQCLGGGVIKRTEFRWKCGSAGSHWKMRDIFSDSELEDFLRGGYRIICRLRIHPSSVEEARSLPGNDPMAFLDDATWPRGGDLSRMHPSQCVTRVEWYIGSLLEECRAARESSGSTCKIKSVDFSFGDATFTLFASLDAKDHRSRLGIYFRTCVSSEEEFVCCCKIRTQEFRCKFRCESAESHWDVTDFLSQSEMDEFLSEWNYIDCTISRQTCSNREASSRTEVPSSSKSGVLEAHTQTEHLENKDDEVFKIASVSKLCRDFKQLLLSGEESDTTVRVQGQQFRVHRLILVTRSSVFSSMFRHDMKEKATGVVDLEDCEASAFPVLLEYLYCGSTEKLSTENMFGLYTSADKYNVQDLKAECLEFIRNNLSVETFCDTVKLSLLHSETGLLKLCIDFFARNMKKIVITANWQSFILEHPIQGNEMYIKALGLDKQDE